MYRLLAVASVALVTSIAALASHPGAGGAVSADGQTTWSGVYSQAQVKRGETLYNTQCMVCHGQDLEGKMPAPELAGDSFLAKWDGQPLANLFEKMQTTMPATHPNGLKRSENADILAFILNANSFPAGSADLTDNHDALNSIKFTKTQPK